MKGKTDRVLEKKGKKNKKCQSKKRPIRGPFIMESSHVTLRENGNKMICQTGNRIRGLPIAEYLPPWCSFFFSSLKFSHLAALEINSSCGSRESSELCVRKV